MSAHSHTELYYHFTWSTKLRKKIILPAWEDRLYGFIRFKCKEIDLQVIALNGVEEHMHLLVRAQAEHSPAMIAHDAKGASSHFINSESLTPKRFSWQNGYGAFSVSPHQVAKVKRYIERQKEHHGRGTAISEWEEDGGESGKSD